MSSVPLSMAEASGPEETRVEGSGGWYVEQHLAACRWVMDQLHDDAPELPDWQLVYLGRSRLSAAADATAPAPEACGVEPAESPYPVSPGK